MALGVQAENGQKVGKGWIGVIFFEGKEQLGDLKGESEWLDCMFGHAVPWSVQSGLSSP